MISNITKIGKSSLWALLLCCVLQPWMASIAAPEAVLIEFWDDSEEQSAMSIDHSPWQEILDKYLVADHPSGINRFRYRAVNAGDRSKLLRYLSYLQEMDPRQLSRAEQKAYWINLYNAATVNLVITEGRREDSIRDIRSGFFTPGPWQRKLLTVAGQELTLDDIEHGILRPIWQDNRIHYAVNCASIGCPNLLPQAYTRDNTEQLLERAAGEFINHPRAVSVRNSRLVLSSIFDWYVADFGGDLAGVIAHLMVYAEEPLKSQISGRSSAEYVYDWQFNRP